MTPASKRVNGLNELLEGIFAGDPTGQQTISLPFTLAESSSYTPLTLNRILLSYSFMSIGLIQTVIKQPVEDAFRGGIEIISDELMKKRLI